MRAIDITAMERLNRVEELFHAALSLEPSARARFLAEACASEPDLRIEIESLIEAHEQPGSFIDTPAYRAFDLVEDELSESLIGTSIGRYQVIRLIKRSGMGEVFLARDKHLPRDVALKLLPMVFTGDDSRLRRFILEAQAVSSLNHPNILTIHEIGHIEDVHFIATEFVDGETLRERMGEGKLKLTEAVEIAIGVTSALVASHAAGITHRDIKPENIMIRRDGYVKVLDFGLAKLTEQPDIKVDQSGARISMMHTDPGTLMGTIGYLSPEQAQASEVDTRSDLFSQGVVLYEMIAGQSPFGGRTAPDVIGAILNTEPPKLAASNPAAPASLQRIVDRALRKDKEDRYQRAEELLEDLKTVKAELERKASPGVLPQSKWLRLGISAAAIIVLAFLAIAILKTFRPASVSQRDNAFLRLVFPELRSWKSERGELTIDARFSRDGHWIAFTRMNNQANNIWVQQALPGAEARQITLGTTNNTWPIWSPDSQQIAFVSRREGKVGIWSILVNGGTETLLTTIEGATVRTRSWSKDGSTIYYELNSNLFGLDVANGTTKQLTQFADKAWRGHFSLSPGEDRICYVEIKNGQTEIGVASLNGESPFFLTDDPTADLWPTWHPDGKRIFFTSKRGDAFQVCFAFVDRTKTTQLTNAALNHCISDISGDGTRLLDVGSRDDAALFVLDVNTGRDPEFAGGSGAKVWPTVSPDGGTIMFESGQEISGVQSSNIVVKRPPTDAPLVTIAANGFDPSWSPDGTRVAFLRLVSDEFEIFVSALGGIERRLTTGGVKPIGFSTVPTIKFGRSVCWSEKGDKIIYSSPKSGVSNLWAVSVDGSADTQVTANSDPILVLSQPVCGPYNRIAFVTESKRGSDRSWSLSLKDNETTEVIYESKSLLRPIGWSAAGSELIAAFAERDIEDRPTSVNMISCSTDGRCRKSASLAATYFWTVELAPDGRTIAFVSSRGGLDNIWRKDSTGGEAQQLTANNDPKVVLSSFNWSPDGKSIYYGRETSVGFINMIEKFE